MEKRGDVDEVITLAEGEFFDGLAATADHSGIRGNSGICFFNMNIQFSVRPDRNIRSFFGAHLQLSQWLRRKPTLEKNNPVSRLSKW